MCMILYVQCVYKKKKRVHRASDSVNCHLSELMLYIMTEGFQMGDHSLEWHQYEYHPCFSLSFFSLLNSVWSVILCKGDICPTSDLFEYIH